MISVHAYVCTQYRTLPSVALKMEDVFQFLLIFLPFVMFQLRRCRARRRVAAMEEIRLRRHRYHRRVRGQILRRGLAVRRQTVAYALMFAAAMAVDCAINYGTYMDISRAWPCLHRMLSLYIAGSDPEPRLHSNLDPARGIRPGSDRSREVDQIPGSDPDRPHVYTCL